MSKEILLLIISVLGGFFDWKYRKIPNWLIFGIFIFIFLINIFSFKLQGIVNCLLGFTVGILLLIIPYLKGGMGAGDVKLLAVIGSIVGVKDVIFIFFYSAFCGLLLGLVWIIFNSGHFKFLITTGQMLPVVDKKQKVPYGVAIALGTILYITFGINDEIFSKLWQ
ncbi:MAG: prepilin peptidase [Candidatus Melainabacteria bacterium]|nr:prepilin peptidase [Candidatus Melainabacteria bacterium]